jgi:hypothetical protein
MSTDDEVRSAYREIITSVASSVIGAKIESGTVQSMPQHFVFRPNGPQANLHPVFERDPTLAMRNVPHARASTEEVDRARGVPRELERAMQARTAALPQADQPRPRQLDTTEIRDLLPGQPETSALGRRRRAVFGMRQRH